MRAYKNNPLQNLQHTKFKQPKTSRQLRREAHPDATFPRSNPARGATEERWVNAGQWHHVAVTRQRDEVRHFIDGVRVNLDAEAWSAPLVVIDSLAQIADAPLPTGPDDMNALMRWLARVGSVQRTVPQPDHPDAGKEVPQPRRFRRSVGGNLVTDTRQADGTVARKPTKTEGE